MLKSQLPDPRLYPSSGASPLLGHAEEAAGTTEGTAPLAALADEIASLLEQGDGQAVRDAIHQAPSAPVARALYQALDLALTNASRNEGVSMHMFAIPVLLVVGAQSAQRLPGVLPEPLAIHALFEESGVLGHCRNFGISNALASLESVQAAPWSAQYARLKQQQWDGCGDINLPPEDIDVVANRETVYLRFIYGAAVTPASAPAFVESAGDIGRWGIKLTKELGRQLAKPDLSLLAIPRLPRSFIRATKEGWFAAREIGFQLFLSNALRQARMRIGEPDVTISAASDQTVRVRLTSPLDDLLDQTYGWPLSPADDFDEIVSSIAATLEEVKLERVRFAPEIEQISNAKPAAH